MISVIACSAMHHIILLETSLINAFNLYSVHRNASLLGVFICWWPAWLSSLYLWSCCSPFGTAADGDTYVYAKMRKKDFCRTPSHTRALYTRGFNLWHSTPWYEQTGNYTLFISSQKCGVKGIKIIMWLDVNTLKPHYFNPVLEKPHSTCEVCYYLERCFGRAF